MARYHVNKAGIPGPCNAIRECPFGDLIKDHYSTPGEAAKAYEAKRVEDSISTLSKSSAVKESVTETLVTEDAGGPNAETELPPLKKPSQKILREMLKEYDAIDQWHPELTAIFKEKERFGYGDPKRSPASGVGPMMVNFLAHHQGMGFTREQLNLIQGSLVKRASTINPSLRKSNDVIQTVNKSDQKGLRRFTDKINGELLYGLKEVRFDDARNQHRVDSTSEEFLAQSEAKSRSLFAAWAKEKEYQKGHKDPRKPLSDDNVVMQPKSLNQAAKDDFIFDDRGLPVIPTPEKIDKFVKKYYDDNDLEVALVAIHKEIERRKRVRGE